MPRRKRSFVVHPRWSTASRRLMSSVRSRRGRPANKKYRRRRGGGYTTRPTTKSLQKQVTRLYKRDDRKHFYVKINNALISGGPPPGPAFFAYDLTTCPYNNQTDAAGTGPQADPNIGGQYSPAQCREPDSLKCNIKNIRIHATLHVSAPEAGRTEKCLLMLVKTRNGVGSVGGITMPIVQQIYDGYAGFGGVANATSLLAPWECFRNTGPGGYGARFLNEDVFKILWKKEVWLSPQQGEQAQNLRTTGTNPAAGTPETGTIVSSASPVPPAPLQNYTTNQVRHSNIRLNHTHNCMGANIEYTSNGSSDAVNVKYFLVALSGSYQTNMGFRLNAVCKINFVDV